MEFLGCILEREYPVGLDEEETAFGTYIQVLRLALGVIDSTSTAFDGTLLLGYARSPSMIIRIF